MARRTHIWRLHCLKHIMTVSTAPVGCPHTRHLFCFNIFRLSGLHRLIATDQCPATAVQKCENLTTLTAAVDLFFIFQINLLSNS